MGGVKGVLRAPGGNGSTGIYLLGKEQMVGKTTAQVWCLGRYESKAEKEGDRRAVYRNIG